MELDMNNLPEKPDALNHKQWQFCINYMSGMSATVAYQKAYHCGFRVAGTNGHRLLKNAVIQSILQDYWQSQRMGIDELFYHLADIARGLGAEYFDENGRLDFRKLKQHNKTHLIADVRENRNGRSYRFHDRLRALEMIGRGWGAFTDNINQSDDIQIHVTIGGENPAGLNAPTPPIILPPAAGNEGETDD